MKAPGANEPKMSAKDRPDDIHQALVTRANQGRRGVLALVLEACGSTPCKAGARALMDGQRVLGGTIGGGWVEVEAARRSGEVMRTGIPVVLSFDLASQTVNGGKPICGGSVRVLLDPTTDRHREAYAALIATREERQRGVLLTTVRHQETCSVQVAFLAESAIPTNQPFPGNTAVRSVLDREQTRLVTHPSRPEGRLEEVLVEAVTPAPQLLIVGGGHVGQAVAALAGRVGFAIAVIDDRPEFTRPELFPGNTTLHCGAVGEQLVQFPIRQDTYVVIVTRGHQHDAEALAACLRTPAAYLGMIGSRRKVTMMRRDFMGSGQFTAAELDRVFAPVGLDIGAATVAEIAVSIVAQMIAVRRTGDAPRMDSSPDADAADRGKRGSGQGGD